MEDDGRNRGRDAVTGKFLAGNPGRPPGTRCRATRAAEAILDGSVDALTRKAVQMALAGDQTAMRLCLERIVAPRKDRPVRVELPPLRRAEDGPAALASIAEAAAEGELAPGEAADVSALVHRWSEAAGAAALAERLDRLERYLGLAEGMTDDTIPSGEAH